MEAEIRRIQPDPPAAANALRPIRRRSEENSEEEREFDAELQERQKRGKGRKGSQPAERPPAASPRDERTAPPTPKEDGDEDVGGSVDLIA